MKKYIFLFLLILNSYFLILNSTPVYAQTADWWTVAANPQRTSWVPQEVTDALNPVWYRPIEAFIPMNAHVITYAGNLYISTSRGMYVFRASDGAAICQYNTELPLGNSPTVVNNIAYVGGYDRRVHAIHATNCTEIWSFPAPLASVNVQAGFSANPLVVNGVVYAPNRDGRMYAIDANNGIFKWQFPASGELPLGMIDQSAAFSNNTIYFAANDNFAYAVNATTGQRVWKSEKMPGDGYQSYWPVIYQDKVVFSASYRYRDSMDPGSATIGSDSLYQWEGAETFALGGYVQITPPAGSAWTHDSRVFKPVGINRYLSDPTPTPNASGTVDVKAYSGGKPWRRVFVVLNTSDGSEYKVPADTYYNRPAYAPFIMTGTHSGNRYPPIIGPDGVLYAINIFKDLYIPSVYVMGWRPDSTLVTWLRGEGAADEPAAISGGGTIVYRNLCCDRVGDFFSYIFDTSLQDRVNGTMWNYNIWNQLNSSSGKYDLMWWGIDPNSSMQRLEGNYGFDATSSLTNPPPGGRNGIYNEHGDQNPIIPYQGKLFTIRSNAIIAYGSGGGLTKLPIQRVSNVTVPVSSPSDADLKSRLDREISKIISVGSFLRPGYYVNGQFASTYSMLGSYFENPGDTLYALSAAYPYVSASLKQPLKTYLNNFYDTYFTQSPVTRIGWGAGKAAREAMPMPDDLKYAINASQDSTYLNPEEWPWSYPQHTMYALWKYAQVVSDTSVSAPNTPSVSQIYNFAKGKRQNPPSFSQDRIWFHNAWIAGYQGYVELAKIAGDTAEATSRQSTLNSLLSSRASNFNKDTPFAISNTEPVHQSGGAYHQRTLNIARNFIWMVPELGNYLNQNALSKVQTAINEYNQVAPYWFSARYNAAVDEGSKQNLYDYHALFLAKAYGLKESKESLTKYLDVPAFEKGDLFYIQNLIAAIQAPYAGATPTSSPVTPTPNPVCKADIDNNGVVNKDDLLRMLGSFAGTGAGEEDQNGDGKVNILDTVWILKYWNQTCL